MATNCPMCDGSLYYDTCEDCGAVVEDSYATRSGGMGSLNQPLSDEEYRQEIEKLMR